MKLLCCDIFYYNSKENISIEIGNFIDERGRWKRSEAIKVRTCKIIENTCKHTLEVIQSYTAGDIKVRDATVTSFFAVFFEWRNFDFCAEQKSTEMLLRDCIIVSFYTYFFSSMSLTRNKNIFHTCAAF